MTGREIKIFNLGQTSGTRDEIRRRYDGYVREAKTDGWVFDQLASVAVGDAQYGPPPVVPSDIRALWVKSLMTYCVPVFDGNPHIGAPHSAQGDVWLENNEEVYGVDKTFRSYTVASGQKYRIIGLYPQYRKDSGSPIKDHNVPLPLSMGIWSPVWPILLAPRVSPPPLHAASIVPISADLDLTTREINAVRQLLLEYNPSLDVRVPLLDIRRNATVTPDRIKISPFILQLERITGQRVSRYYATGTLADLPRDVYQSAGAIREAAVDRLTRVMEHQHTLRDQMVKQYAAALHSARLYAVASKQYGITDISKLTREQRDNAERKIANMTHISASDPNDPIKYMLRQLRESFGHVDLLRKQWVLVRSAFDIPADLGTELLAPKHNPEMRIMCPHLVDRAQMELDRSDNLEIGDILAHKWAEKVPTNYHYYCRVCGELLYIDHLDDFNIFGPQQIISGIGDQDLLKTRIFSEVSQTVRLVKFRNMIGRNLKSLVASITEALYPEIQRLQDELQSMKTRSLDDTVLTLTLYTSIYAFAFMTKLIVDNPDKAEWNVTKGKGHQTALTVAYALILSTKGSLIAKIKDFYTEMIKSVFEQAYRFVTRVQFQTVEEQDDEMIVAESSLVRDPTYLVALMMWGIDHGGMSPPSPASVFGITDYKELGVDKPYEKMYRSAGDTPLHRAYQQWLEYVNDIVPGRYSFVPVHPILSAWWEKWTDFITPLPPMTPSPRMRLYTYKPEPIREAFISDLHCPDGHRHDFSTKNAVYVYGDRKLKLGEIPREGPPSRITREECGRCGHPSSGAPPSDRAAAINGIVDRMNVFRYFANRCPATGVLHNYPVGADGFVGNNACPDCSYRPSFIDAMPNDWYDRWHTSMPVIVTESVEVQQTAVPERKTDTTGWSISLASILQISKISGIPYNIWINIGLTEKQSWSALRNGNINPQVSATPDRVAARNIKIAGYIEQVRVIYYMIKNHARIQVTPQIKHMLDEEPPGVNLQEALPDILQGYSSWRNGLNPVEMSNYLLHTLCATLLGIRAMEGPVHKFAVRLFRYLADAIITSESLISAVEIQKRHITARTDDDLDDDESVEVMEEQSDDDDEGDIENSNTGNDDEEFMD